MKKILILLSLMAFIGVASAVTWNVSLVDSYGDGWNGGTLTVNVNGSPVLSAITLASGFGPQLFPITVVNGDAITTVYTPGSWSYENEYYIYDHNNALIASQGAGDTVPASITTPIIVVAPANAPGLPTNPSPATGAGGVSISPTLTWTFGTLTTTYDLMFGPTGAMTQVVTGAAAGATGSYTPPILNSLTSYSWQVIAHNTNTRLSTSGPVWTFTTIPGPGSVVIGNGTALQRQPFGIYWGYERSAALYTAAQIGTTGVLDQVAWYCGTTSTSATPYKIYAKMTTETAFTAATWADFVGTMQLVDQGTYTFNTAGWHNFVLDSVFTYSGGNLVIAVETFYGGTGVSPYQYFQYSTGTAGSHMYWFADSAPPTGVGTLNALLPNVLLHLTAGGTGLVPPILVYPGIDAINLPKTGFAFQWSPDLVNGEMPDSYNLYVSTTDVDEDSFFGAATLYQNVTSPFNPGITYNYLDQRYWTVASVIAGVEAYVWPPRRYTIEDDPTIDTFCYYQDFETWPPLNWNLAGGTYNFVHYADASLNHWARANYWSQTSGNTDIMTSPAIISPDMLQLKFLWSHLYSSSYPLDALTVQVSSNQVDWDNIWYKAGVDFNSNDGAGNTTPGTGVQEIVPIPATYTNGTDPFWVRFYGFSGYGPDLFIDDVWLCIPLDHDVGPTVIGGLPGEVVPPSLITPTATIVNYGVNTETFNVSITWGTTYSNTQTVTALAPGASIVVTFASFTPAVNTVGVVTVTTLLGTDQNAANNVITANLISLNLNIQAYADVAYDPSAVNSGPATFNLSTPGTITDLNAVNPWVAGSFLAGGDWMNGGWYGAEYDDGTLVKDNYWQIDPITGVGTDLGDVGVPLTGVAFDPNHNVLYGVGYDSVALVDKLYTLNPATGVATLLGTLTGNTGGLMIGIAYNSITNVLYGIDLGVDALFTINPTTLVATEVGPFGVDLNYAQDPAFDQTNGKLYLAGYTTTGSLYWINTANGGAYKIGDFQSGAELDGFAIPYTSALPAPVVTVALVAGVPTVSWAAVSGASSYIVYGSANPYAADPWTLLTNTTQLSYSYTGAAAYYFFKVVATNNVTRTDPAPLMGIETLQPKARVTSPLVDTGIFTPVYK